MLFPPVLVQEFEDNGGELRSGTLNQMQAKARGSRQPNARMAAHGGSLHDLPVVSLPACVSMCSHSIVRPSLLYLYRRRPMCSREGRSTTCCCRRCWRPQMMSLRRSGVRASCRQAELSSYEGSGLLCSVMWTS